MRIEVHRHHPRIRPAVYRSAREARRQAAVSAVGATRVWGRSEVGGVEGRNEITARIKNQSEIYPGAQWPAVARALVLSQ
jgi:hypothetical protein